MKEQAYNIIRPNIQELSDKAILRSSRKQNSRSHLRNSKTTHWGRLLASKYVFKHGSSESAGSLASGEILMLLVYKLLLLVLKVNAAGISYYCLKITTTGRVYDDREEIKDLSEKIKIA
ncbi:hypothetical protein Tco_0429050 [Tanacetum coccineum]